MDEGVAVTESTMTAESFTRATDGILASVGRVIDGKPEAVRSALVCLLAEGHLLIEDVPGVGKTMLARALAASIDATVRRIQFTPDLLPGDVTGVSVFNPVDREFEFKPGAIFAHIVIADEINRSSPKTQSALLEAMQEGHVTVGGETRHLPQPFFVLATQNPLEMEGTYPLPEAQMDRFFFQLIVPYPAEEEFARILELTTSGVKEEVTPVLSGQELLEMRAIAASVPATATMRQRAVRLVMATHPESPYATAEVKRYVRYGASPRAGQACIAAAKIAAALSGRFHVASEDLVSVAHPILRHRMMLNFEAQADGLTADRILDGVVNECRAAWAREAS